MPNDAITPFILAVPQADLALEICGFVRYRSNGLVFTDGREMAIADCLPVSRRSRCDT
jgi:hypothetical protein